MSSLKLISSAFADGASIPKKYTCEGSDTSPPLEWTGVPSGAKSLALIIDDPDAPDPAKPQRVWVHWVLYDIPVSTSSLDENASQSGPPTGTRVGKNDWKKESYGGPCPPVGRHRYFHKLYALDTVLGLDGATKADVERAMQGHILGKAEIVGTYEKGKS
jgi:Raf kinase inhibitor-like YbhB/YbcL family protein